MKINKGFTLIELMITVAIIGILMLMALPLYRSYVVRTKTTEVIMLLSSFMNEKIIDIEFDRENEIHDPDWRNAQSRMNQEAENIVKPNRDWIKEVEVQWQHSLGRSAYQYTVVVDLEKLGIKGMNVNDKYASFTTSVFIPIEDNIEITDSRKRDEGIDMMYVETPQQVCGYHPFYFNDGDKGSWLPYQYLPSNCRVINFQSMGGELDITYIEDYL